ncbi:transglycosylase SLT domain-containing protein [Alkalilimnicola sp. S0819]|uniref:transglycosylase SLT domain-containing protein n=1 Tax=Alkalilimnicola sp. S0819 TaxID=2613922 RepID=UPI001262685F|nr:transglycosylase SLT domain-containing protein [Alkalilimnicola sp. S0819]KAB7627679.1 transglycosylase SLT domain-containing protein [Alkalilimnicola sp. S0819]MPQ15846.1 transglycosylase SLT domain-containing protein [Alkalilimnicola sp. S0819]
MRPILAWLLAALLAGCATKPPSEPHDACEIFREKPDWYEASREAAERWGTPVHVQLAIMHQESTFVHDARPPRGRLLWVIPWRRPSSAYGYAQVLDGTWRWYQEDTGRHGASRDDYADAADFVAWYVHTSHRMLGLSKWNIRAQYLAYHEGQGGYRRGTHRHKGWLVRVADRVSARGSRYHTQLSRCAEALNNRGWWPFW